MRRGENIYKRKDGRWEGRYIVSRDKNGKACYRSIYAKTYTEVREKLKNVSKDCIPSMRALFEVIGNNWLNSVKLRCKLSTYNKYSSTYRNQLLPDFKGNYINDINSLHIEEMLSEKELLSDKTKADILSIMKLIVKYAERCGFNIDRTIYDLSVRQAQVSTRVLSEKEQEILENYLLKENNLISVGTYLVLYSGLRIGELCALKRGNIDFTTNILHIDATMQRTAVENDKAKTKVLITSPKSKCSIRDIPIPESIMKIFKKYYSNMSGDNYILTGNKNYIEPRLLRYHFNQYVNACKLKDVHFHTLRHTFSTRCIECGVDPKSLSEILGHHDVKITLNRYVHPSLKLKKQSIEKLCH